jgi:hypothetical protein
VSRPSRGFTVSDPRPKSVPTCPAASVITLEINSPDDWQLPTDWVPAINVGTLSLYASINGGVFDLLDVGNNVDSGYTFEFNPQASGSPGDEIRLRVDATDVGGCPDFFSNVITQTIG